MAHGVVIVGASVAGYNVAKELRAKGYEGKITLISKQTSLPYDLKPLSKDWMLAQDHLLPPVFQDESFYHNQNITLKLATEIVAILPEEHRIQTANKEEIPYDQLVLAIGSTLRILDAPGVDAAGIFYLRDIKDASKIKQWDKKTKDVVIVGAGFIGLEMASTFAQVGLNVTVIEHAEYPLGRIIGTDASHYFTNMHRARDVNILTAEDVTEFEKDADGNVKAAITASGKTIPCQMVIIGIGVIPNTSISHPDLEVQRGFVVNEYGQTSLPDVYAAGDCTVWPYEGELIHVEHWEHARAHGRYIARNIINPKSEPYAVRPYFWTDEYDQTFEYLGHAMSWEQAVIRGSLDEREFSIAYLDEEQRPLAILFANNAEKRKDVAALMDGKRPIDPIKFQNSTIPIQET